MQKGGGALSCSGVDSKIIRTKLLFSPRKKLYKFPPPPSKKSIEQASPIRLSIFTTTTTTSTTSQPANAKQQPHHVHRWSPTNPLPYNSHLHSLVILSSYPKLTHPPRLCHLRNLLGPAPDHPRLLPGHLGRNPRSHQPKRQLDRWLRPRRHRRGNPRYSHRGSYRR